MFGLPPFLHLTLVASLATTPHPSDLSPLLMDSHSSQQCADLHHTMPKIPRVCSLLRLKEGLNKQCVEMEQAVVVIIYNTHPHEIGSRVHYNI